MNEENRRKGYTSVSLGEELMNKIDTQGKKSGGINRSLMIRLILEKYYELKDKGVDTLKVEVDDFGTDVRINKLKDDGKW